MYKYIILFILLEYNILNPTIMHLRDLPDMGTVVYCLSTGRSAFLYCTLGYLLRLCPTARTMRVHLPRPTRFLAVVLPSIHS